MEYLENYLELDIKSLIELQERLDKEINLRKKEAIEEYKKKFKTAFLGLQEYGVRTTYICENGGSLELKNVDKFEFLEDDEEEDDD